MTLDWWDLGLRLLSALAFGAVIGAERQWRARMAGLRTNALVATGAALFVLLSVLTPGDASPTRIAAQVVSGIGFLGAGVIIRDGVNLRGINTAATIWGAAAVGCLCGAGLLLPAAAGTGAIIAVNLLLRPAAHQIDRRATDRTSSNKAYVFRAVCRDEDEAHVRVLLVQSLSGEEFAPAGSAQPEPGWHRTGRSAGSARHHQRQPSQAGGSGQPAQSRGRRQLGQLADDPGRRGTLKPSAPTNLRL